jgi:hypothetical protein
MPCQAGGHPNIPGTVYNISFYDSSGNWERHFPFPVAIGLLTHSTVETQALEGAGQWSVQLLPGEPGWCFPVHRWRWVPM